MTERYLGFYLSRPFWAGERLDVTPDRALNDEYPRLMEQWVFSHKTERFHLAVCKDGLFLLQLPNLAQKIAGEYDSKRPPDFEDSLNTWSQYLRSANALVLMFESAFLRDEEIAYFEIRELTNKDAFGVRYENGKWSGSGVPTLSYAEKYVSARHPKLIRATNGLFLAESTLYMGRPELKRSTFESLAANFEIAIKQDGCIDALADLTKSIGEYKAGNFGTSIVLSWFIVEAIVNQRWESHLDKVQRSGHSISGNRMKRLLNSNMPVSTKIETLELQTDIPNDLYLKLDHARGARNRVVHRDPDFRTTVKSASDAIMAAKELIKHHFGIDIEVNLSLSLSGL